MEAVHALGHLAQIVREGEIVGHLDPPDDENSSLGPDLSSHQADQVALFELRAARLQRSGKGPGQSAARRGDDVVERRGV